MKERINWIDWAKAAAVCTVVFCHLPQSQEDFYFRYLQSCVITVFFFLSGYLKKDRGSDRENWRKYWRGLVVPYLLYNLVVYPYWLVKYYMLHGGMPDVSAALRPVVGALLFQHENSFAEPLNGPLWYLPAILLMHVTIDQCRKTRLLHPVMITLCVLSFFLYAANKYWAFLPNLTPMGIFRRLPYYYIGYVMGRDRLLRSVSPWRDLVLCAGLLATSLVLFWWHLDEKVFLLHIALFYPVNLCFLFGVLSGCKLMDRVKWNMVTNLSVGTLVVIGLHTPVISLVNVVTGHHTDVSAVVSYSWYEALLVTAVVVAALYPVIRLGRRYWPLLLGR